MRPTNYAHLSTNLLAWWTPHRSQQSADPIAIKPETDQERWPWSLGRASEAA